MDGGIRERFEILFLRGNVDQLAILVAEQAAGLPGIDIKSIAAAAASVMIGNPVAVIISVIIVIKGNRVAGGLVDGGSGQVKERDAGQGDTLCRDVGISVKIVDGVTVAGGIFGGFPGGGLCRRLYSNQVHVLSGDGNGICAAGFLKLGIVAV